MEGRKSRRFHEESSRGADLARAFIGENRLQREESISTRGKSTRKIAQK